MDVSIDVSTKIGAGVLSAIVTEFLRRRLNTQSRVVCFYGHVSSFPIPPTEPEKQPIRVHAHSVVVRNTGSKIATNVTLTHSEFPGSYHVDPPLHFEITKSPSGSTAISFPRLVPGQQVTVAYMYGSDITFLDVNGLVFSDDGPARVLKVIPAEQLSPVVARAQRLLLWIGMATTIYWILWLVWTLALVSIELRANPPS